MLAAAGGIEQCRLPSLRGYRQVEDQPVPVRTASDRGLVVAERLSIREKRGDGTCICAMQFVRDLGKPRRHHAQQSFHIVGVLFDHRTGAVRIGQRDARHVPPASRGERSRDVAVRVVGQLVDERRGDDVRHV